MGEISSSRFVGLAALIAILVAGLGLTGCQAGSSRVPNKSTVGVVVATTTAGMVHLPAGRFRMGTNHGEPYEGPAHEIEVTGFWMDSHEVTNAEFAQFIEATGYKTEAEQWRWAGVFNQESGEWQRVDGADWRHPEGIASDSRDRPNHPVVQVSWNDAAAYAKWAGKRLPTEAEWEWATRGSLSSKTYAWGDELRPGGKFMANYWQGDWPTGNSGADGFKGTAAVGSFPAIGYGLFDMTGNVWEWTADWFAPYNPKEVAASSDGKAECHVSPVSGEERVMRGGSFLCNEHFCSGYRVAARNKNTPESATNNLGFRCVRDE